MLKNKLWLGIILSIILLAFSINGFAFDYTYTQQSGEGFFVAFPDKSDAQEDTNEIRLIVNDLGALLVHSKMDGTYPKDLEAGGTLAIPNSALVSFSTGTKGDLWYCSDTNVWTKLSIGADNQILVVATDVPNWETPSSNLLSDVADIGMLNENEDITGAWTISTGSIAGVDSTEFGYLALITAFGGSIIDDANEAAFKSTVNLEIGTDVLAQQTIGIANDNLLEMDQVAGGAIDDYCKLTANGIVGRSYSEVKTDLGINLSLYYLKTEIDTFKLSAFAATTSAELAGVISDETGTLKLVYSDSPVFTTKITTPKVIRGVITITDGDTTPDISGGEIFITSSNTEATEITDLDNPTVGQIVTIIIGNATNPSTITDGGNFALSADWTPDLDDVITLFVQADNDYIEISRSAN